MQKSKNIHTIGKNIITITYNYQFGSFNQTMNLKNRVSKNKFLSIKS